MDNYQQVLLQMQEFGIELLDKNLPLRVDTPKRVTCGKGGKDFYRLYTFRPQATLDLRIDYMRAANPRADMVARAECYRVAREIACVRGVAHDGDIADPVASFSACFMFTGPAMHPGDRGHPTKPEGAKS